MSRKGYRHVMRLGEGAGRRIARPKVWVPPAQSAAMASPQTSARRRGSASRFSIWSLRCSSRRHHSQKCSQLFVKIR